MKKTILIVMVLVILCVGMVEGKLGSELVTCWDFTCNDGWVGLPDITEYEVVSMVNKNGVPIVEYEIVIQAKEVPWYIKWFSKIFKVKK